MGEFRHIITLYDIQSLGRTLSVLKCARIEYQLENLSGPTNYRVPQSTFRQVNIRVKEDCYEQAYNLLKEEELV